MGPGQNWVANFSALVLTSVLIFCKNEISGIIKGKGLFKSLPLISNILLIEVSSS